jgi:hypothetical protein
LRHIDRSSDDISVIIASFQSKPQIPLELVIFHPLNEYQFRNDKNGLHLAARRKRRFPAQKALILLTDLAHNLLADFHRMALTDTKFEDFGPKRMVRDLLAIPGKLTFEEGQLKRIDLIESHPHAKSMLVCLKKHDWGE